MSIFAYQFSKFYPLPLPSLFTAELKQIQEQVMQEQEKFLQEFLTEELVKSTTNAEREEIYALVEEARQNMKLQRNNLLH